MEQAHLLPWPDQKSEIIFACHTSMVSQQILIDKISKFVDLSNFEKAVNQKNKEDKWKNLSSKIAKS